MRNDLVKKYMDVRRQLEAERKHILGRLQEIVAALEGGETAKSAGPSPARPMTRRLSRAARARIRAAQKARWAKVRRMKQAPKAGKVSKRPKRKLSAAGRARIAAAAKARWAKAKAAGKSSL